MTSPSRSYPGPIPAALPVPRGSRLATRPRGDARRLRNWVLWAMALPLFVIPLRSSELAIEDRLLAGAFWALCLLPAWLYLRTPLRKRAPIPFLPFVGLEYALYYAVQGVLGNINVYGRFEVSRLGFLLQPEMFSRPLMMALLGWILLLVGYYVTGMFAGSFRQRRVRQWQTADLTRWGLRILAFGILVEVIQRVIGNPMLLRGLLYFGGTLTLLSISLLTILSVRKELTKQQQLLFILGAGLTIFLRAGTSATAQLVIIVLTILFSVWIGGGRISSRWAWAGLVAGLLFVSIRGVVNEQRKSDAFVSDEMPIIERSTLLFSLLANRVEREGIAGTVAGGFESVAGRSALLDLFADVVRQTPETVPYWDGETYLSIVGAVVPRFLWPDKPVKITGYTFGQRYHYIAPGDFTTTINLPYLIEFYANFGELAVYLGMLLVGVLYRGVERLVNNPGQPILRTVVGMGLLLPLINIESDFSLVFGGLFLTGGALYALYRVAMKASRFGRAGGPGSGPARTAAGPVAAASTLQG